MLLTQSKSEITKPLNESQSNKLNFDDYFDSDDEVMY